MAPIDLPVLPDNLVLRCLQKSDFEKGTLKRKEGESRPLFFSLLLLRRSQRQVRIFFNPDLSPSLQTKNPTNTHRLPRPPLAADRRRGHLQAGLRAAIRRDGARRRGREREKLLELKLPDLRRRGDGKEENRCDGDAAAREKVH